MISSPTVVGVAVGYRSTVTMIRGRTVCGGESS